ncbi:MAG: hypothetical protein A2231_02855 [Candidatus Firestonebacteria bacterium RIFOXYA2_FULL_40_8]|nr:MAG: hypothetical protein A2231_02855 [Candidatus Firestonebacteria bacterium RIFOXYA2_FULL_40_8]
MNISGKRIMIFVVLILGFAVIISLMIPGCSDYYGNKKMFYGTDKSALKHMRENSNMSKYVKNYLYYHVPVAIFNLFLEKESRETSALSVTEKDNIKNLYHKENVQINNLDSARKVTIKQNTYFVFFVQNGDFLKVLKRDKNGKFEKLGDLPENCNDFKVISLSKSGSVFVWLMNVKFNGVGVSIITINDDGTLREKVLEVEGWHQHPPELIDLDFDGVKEIVACHRISISGNPNTYEHIIYKWDDVKKEFNNVGNYFLFE